MVEVNTIVKLLCEFVIFIGAIRFYWYRHPFIQSHTFAQPDRQTVNVHNCGAKEFSNKVSFCIGNATKDEATNGRRLRSLPCCFRIINITDLN